MSNYSLRDSYPYSELLKYARHFAGYPDTLTYRCGKNTGITNDVTNGSALWNLSMSQDTIHGSDNARKLKQLNVV